MYLHLIALIILSPFIIILYRLLTPLVGMIRYKIKYGKQMIFLYRPFAGIPMSLIDYKNSHNDSGAFYKDIAKKNPEAKFIVTNILNNVNVIVTDITLIKEMLSKKD